MVTNEQPSPGSRKKGKIPDACAALEVEITDLLTVSQSTGAVLHLHGGGEGERSAELVAPTIPGLD